LEEIMDIENLGPAPTLLSTRRHWIGATTAAIGGLALGTTAFAANPSEALALDATSLGTSTIDANALGKTATGASAARPADENGLSKTAEAIHQESIFKASPKRIYDALMDEEQFQKIELLSLAMPALDLKNKPANISREVGGSFSIFGAYILGRQLELVPNQRIVQAWREIIWDPGVFSIAKFELVEQGTGTKLVFDHTGFPAGAGEHLAVGWKSHYWESLEKFLG
jgi:activator of HSP90 ATPase